MSTLIDVPAGLNGVAVTDTSIGDVDGEAGFFHYRGHDATELARHQPLRGGLAPRRRRPPARRRRAGRVPRRGRRRTACCRRRSLPVLEPLATATGPTLGRVRAAVSIAADELGLRPLIDIEPDERAAQALRVAAVIPTIVAALHRVSLGLRPARRRTRRSATTAGLPAGRHRRDARRRRRRGRSSSTSSSRSTTASTPRRSPPASSRRPVPTSPTSSAPPSARSPARCTAARPSRALDALDAIGDPAGTEAGSRPRSPPAGGSWASATPSTAPATPARRCCARSPPGSAATSSTRPIDVEAPDPRHAAPAQAGPPAAEQRRVLRRRRDGVGRPASGPVHPDVRRQPHDRLDRPTPSSRPPSAS